LTTEEKPVSGPSILDRLDGINELHFRIGVIGLAGVLFIFLLSLRFCYEVGLPPASKKPARTQETPDNVSSTLVARTDVYERYLQQDAKDYGVDAPTLDDMKKPFVHTVHELVTVLKPSTKRASMEAAGLRLTTSVRGGNRTQDRRLVLSIDNLTEEHLAYRIVTKPTKGVQMCQHQKMKHNGMVIGPGETVTRAECSYKKGVSLKVARVETLAVPPLSARYISAVTPLAIGLDPRPVGTFHKPMSGVKACNVVIGTSITDQVRSGEGDVSWRDIIDFYARHRCAGATYSYVDGYKAFEKGDKRRLPVVSED
jgi:hypothetical protein